MSTNINFIFKIKDYNPNKESEILDAARKFVADDDDWSRQAEIKFSIGSDRQGKQLIVGLPKYPLGIKFSRLDEWFPAEIRKWQQTIYAANGAECQAMIDWESPDFMD